MDEAITAATKDDEATLDRIAAEVRDLLVTFPAPGWDPGPPPGSYPACLRRPGGSRGPSTGCPRARPGMPSSHGQRPRLSACTSCRPCIRLP